MFYVDARERKLRACSNGVQYCARTKRNFPLFIELREYDVIIGLMKTLNYGPRTKSQAELMQWFCTLYGPKVPRTTKKHSQEIISVTNAYFSVVKMATLINNT